MDILFHKWISQLQSGLSVCPAGSPLGGFVTDRLRVTISR